MNEYDNASVSSTIRFTSSFLMLYQQCFESILSEDLTNALPRKFLKISSWLGTFECSILICYLRTFQLIRVNIFEAKLFLEIQLFEANFGQIFSSSIKQNCFCAVNEFIAFVCFLKKFALRVASKKKKYKYSIC